MSDKSFPRSRNKKKMTRTLTRFLLSLCPMNKKIFFSIIYSINTKVIQLFFFFFFAPIQGDFLLCQDKVVSIRFWHVDNWCSKWPFALMLRRHPAYVYSSLERSSKKKSVDLNLEILFSHTCFYLNLLITIEEIGEWTSRREWRGRRKKIINNASLLVLYVGLHHIHASIADYFHSKRVRAIGGQDFNIQFNLPRVLIDWTNERRTMMMMMKRWLNEEPEKTSRERERERKEKIWYERTNKECDVYAAVVAWLYRNERERESIENSLLEVNWLLTRALFNSFLIIHLPLHHPAVTKDNDQRNFVSLRTNLP